MNWIRSLLSSFYKYLINFVIFTFSVIVSLEVGSWLAVSILNYGDITVADIVAGKDKNNHLVAEGPCKDYSSSFQVHPYLGFTHNNCFPLNEINLLGEKLNLENSDIHRVGIFGGSVASQFSGIQEKSYLSSLLNTCFESGLGKSEFGVLNFADGAWKQPQQVIAISLYGDFIDTAISIEGFNEHYSLLSINKDLSYIADNYSIAIDNANSVIMRSKLLSKLFSKIEGSVIQKLNLTKLSFLALRGILPRVGHEVDTSIRQVQLDPQTLTNYKHPNLSNFDRYKNFIETFHAIAKSKDILSFVILQPAPVYKELTSKEQLMVRDLSYQAIYDELRILWKRLPKSFDYSDLFSTMDDVDIFGDDIHFVQTDGKPFGWSIGDQYLAKTLLNDIEAEYPGHFIRKQNCIF